MGPGPALNAYTKSDGQEIRLIAGAADGGATSLCSLMESEGAG